jgi:Asp-tRNA(Asn)/Glu-tRNA(Gln) amidotransferase C subunit
LGKVDVTGVEPSLRAMGEESTLREDVPVSFPNKCAPLFRDGMMHVVVRDGVVKYMIVVIMSGTRMAWGRS